VTRVLVVDDHPVFRRGICGLLAAGGFDVVGEAAGATEAVALAERLRPDLVVMDIGLPDGSGIDATAMIVGARPCTHVLVVTLFDDQGAVRRALDAGARGYVVKDAGHDEVLAAARAAALGATVLGAGLGLPAVRTLPTGARERFRLSPREAQVADLVVRGLGNAQIAERLGVSGKTVSNLVSNVLAKTGAPDRVAAAALLRTGDDGR